MRASPAPAGGTPRRLDRRRLAAAVAELARNDPDLAAVVHRHGPPPLWARRPGVASLVRIILEQQVSVVSARALFQRLDRELDGITVASILEHGEPGLKRLGVTRQKAAYCCEAASRIAAGELDLARIARLPVAAARDELMRVPGVGPWTAEVYLMMALRRPDVWPTGDVALITAMQRLRRLSRRPSVHEAAEHARRWIPWRAVAARILWHGYLSGSLGRRPRPSSPVK